MLLGLDLGTHLTGYCIGRGDVTPRADAWRFDAVGDDLGLMGARLWAELDLLHRSATVTHVLYESPLKRRYDVLLTLRKLYGMGMIVETWARMNDVACFEASPSALKSRLAGDHWAPKDVMVAAAQRMGVCLPKTDAAGRKDAADAVAAWLVAVQFYAPQHQARWDQVLADFKGNLV